MPKRHAAAPRLPSAAPPQGRRQASPFARTPPAWTPAPRPEREPRVLVIDSDDRAAAETARRLADRGLAIVIARSAEAAEAELARGGFDLVILEPQLPGRDGLTFCREIADRSRAPILIFSAADDPLDRVAGLEFGADDYLGKAAHPLELIARVRALLRRGRREPAGDAAASPAYEFEGLRFDPRSRSLAGPAGERVWLTSAEAGLLQVFLAAPGEVLSRKEVQARLFGSDVHLSDRAIDVRVVRLRRALERSGGLGADLIRTCRRGGYLLAAEVAGP